MHTFAALPAVTRRRKRRTRSARGSVRGSGGKTETGAETRVNAPAARRAKTRSGNASVNANGSASLRATKETSRFVASGESPSDCHFPFDIQTKSND